MAAKVTRDACIEGWHFEETDGQTDQPPWGSELGSGYPAGNFLSIFTPSGQVDANSFVRSKHPSMAKDCCRSCLRLP